MVTSEDRHPPPCPLPPRRERGYLNSYKYFPFIFLFFPCLWAAGEPNQTMMRVAAPVVDVRSEMKDAPPDTYVHDPLEETQLLFGEEVIVRELRGDWALVECVGQQEFTHKKRWEGYPGWVRVRALVAGTAPAGSKKGVVRRFWSDIFADPIRPSSRLIRIPFGSRIDILSMKNDWYEVACPDGRRGWIRQKDVSMDIDPESESHQRLMTRVWKNARRFIGVPYYWGGLSPYDRDYKTPMTGVDCSGLVHLCYRAAGATIPRDSHEQWMMSAPVIRSDLQRGDLIFLANADKPEKIIHVAMYVGGEFLIEGPGTGQNVRRVTFKKKFGRRLSSIKFGDTVADGKKIVYFGRPATDSR